jgi:hypothetical protein
MKHIAFLGSVVAFVAASATPAAAIKCPADSVQVGAACVDRYEASVWSTTDASLVKKIKKGKIDESGDLAGATQHGVGADDYGAGCPDDAVGCTGHYAVSLPNVMPSIGVTWFQAAAACRNAGKRLPSSYEWQMAALGTPDPGTDNGTNDCNVDSALAAVNTGSRSGCVSDVGAFDMVGNLDEWVADWVDLAVGCTDWTSQTGIDGDDISCFGGDGSSALFNIPGALLRGGHWASGTDAGAFAGGSGLPSTASALVGFRCAR